MTDKEKKKIELILGCVFLQIKDGFLDRAWDVYDEFEKQFKYFIDSLQEEPVSEDLEEEYLKYIESHDGEWTKDAYLAFARHFANWQKEQMMAKAVDAQVVLGPNDNHVLMNGLFNNYKYHDKVKLIIVKDE